ncbi:hypothetical protein E3N88_08895 [Mikania micrantha]|uniref:Uncharacterized protein n=1 Tax=Mikania micrantha TaxID=192012 RepID=A0A5N6PHJ1_9ASTR|nr:hypothetical protein E3N88_08895 [Mikania micrantha]
MVNVGEKCARNGVTDCPESQNEKKSKSLRKITLGGTPSAKHSSQAEALIVLLADNPFAGRIASPLVDSDSGETALHKLILVTHRDGEGATETRELRREVNECTEKEKRPLKA